MFVLVSPSWVGQLPSVMGPLVLIIGLAMGNHGSIITVIIGLLLYVIMGPLFRQKRTNRYNNMR